MTISNRIYNHITKNHRFLISTHIGPDLDALCSELSMAVYLQSLGKKVFIVHEQPVPQMYGFLKGISKIKILPKKKLFYDVAFVFDCGELSRVGGVSTLIEKDKPLINIDHHATNTFFGSDNLVKAKASSTTEVLFDFFQEQNVSITKRIAEFLYLGILTDTGSFCYENTTAHTHYVVAQLLRYGLPVYQLYRTIYARLSHQDLKIFLSFLSKLDIFFEEKVIFLCIDQKAILKTKNHFDLRDRLFRILRDFKSLQAMVIFTSINASLTKVNFRSTGRIDVAEIAGRFGGGGHKNASGCQLAMGLKNTKENIYKVIKEYF